MSSGLSLTACPRATQDGKVAHLLRRNQWDCKWQHMHATCSVLQGMEDCAELQINNGFMMPLRSM